MKKLNILAVGKLRTPHWQAAADYYTARLRRSFDVTERIVKDADAANTAERNRLEGERLLAALSPDLYPLCLDEHGRQFTSPEFAVFLSSIYDRAEKTPCFILGGAFGLDPAVLGKSATAISLGAMTLPHELARVVLLEQLYRVDQIWRKSPYHH